MLGNGENGQFTFLDIVSLMSFFIGLENLDVNLTQDDKQELQKDLADKTQLIVEDIHSHLTEQDALLRDILKRLEALENGSR